MDPGERRGLILSVSRPLTKSSSGVLASLRGSTYGQRVRFASSLAAALLDGLSEQPPRYSPDVRDIRQGSFPELVFGLVTTLLECLPS